MGNMWTSTPPRKIAKTNVSMKNKIPDAPDSTSSPKSTKTDRHHLAGLLSQLTVILLNEFLNMLVISSILLSLNCLPSSRTLHTSSTNFLHLIISLTTLSLSLWTSPRSILISLTPKASRLPGNTSTNVPHRDHLQKPYATSSTSSYRTTILSLTDNFSYRNMVLPWALEWLPHMQTYLWGPLKLLP